MAGTDEWRAAWGGWERRYCVARPNGGVLRDGCRTKEEALKECQDRNGPAHMRSTLG
jgi:hypothetical protein